MHSIFAAKAGKLLKQIKCHGTRTRAGGEWMEQIRELTNNYSAPVDACTTFRVSLAELKVFEQDLHRLYTWKITCCFLWR
jgi:regulator of cell morphogenesis and NO signaling